MVALEPFGVALENVLTTTTGSSFLLLVNSFPPSCCLPAADQCSLHCKSSLVGKTKHRLKAATTGQTAGGLNGERRLVASKPVVLGWLFEDVSTIHHASLSGCIASLRSLRFAAAWQWLSSAANG